MTNEQAKKMLKAKLECLKRETSGTDFDCNNSNCDECSLCYEQGNMGEQKEALDMAIKALEQKPYEKFESAKDHIYKLAGDYKCWDNRLTKDEAVELCHILEQQPCEDAISRQAALDAMETWDKFGCDPDGKLVRYDDDKHYIPYVHYEDMVHAIKHLPSAQPEQKKGRWLPDNRPGGGFWVCSCCKFPSEAFAANVLYKFCPNCGADMGGEQIG